MCTWRQLFLGNRLPALLGAVFCNLSSSIFYFKTVHCTSPLCRSVNVKLGSKEDRLLITGLHTVRARGILFAAAPAHDLRRHERPCGSVSVAWALTAC